MLLFYVQIITAQVLVVDSVDGTPVAHASFYDAKGRFLAQNEADGVLSKESLKDNKEVSVSHLAYHTVHVWLDTLKDAVVRLSPRVYQIPETSVTSAQPDYLRIRGYSRSWLIEDSVIRRYEEQISDYYLKLKRKTSRQHVLMKRWYALPTLPSGTKEDNIEESMFYFVQFGLQPDLIINLIKDSLVTDTVVSKDTGQKEFAVHTNPSKGTVVADVDYLSIFKNGRFNFTFLFRLLGVKKVVLNKFTSSETYRISKNGRYEPRDLTSTSNYAQVLYQSKGSTPERELNYFGELYVMDYKFVSKKEMKSAIKSRVEHSSEWSVPDNIPPLPEHLREAVQGMTLR